MPQTVAQQAANHSAQAVKDLASVGVVSSASLFGVPLVTVNAWLQFAGAMLAVVYALYRLWALHRVTRMNAAQTVKQLDNLEG